MRAKRLRVFKFGMNRKKSITLKIGRDCDESSLCKEVFCPRVHIAGADPGEVKWVNFHPPPLSLSPLLSFSFFLSPQPGFGSITLLQKFTPHFKILDPRLYCKLFTWTT